MISWVFIIFLGACLVFILLPLALNEYFNGYRNRRTYKFKLYLADLAYAAANKRINNGLEDWKLPWRIIEKYKYDDICNSFKPFKLEAWFTEEEIKILKGGLDGED